MNLSLFDFDDDLQDGVPGASACAAPPALARGPGAGPGQVDFAQLLPGAAAAGATPRPSAQQPDAGAPLSDEPPGLDLALHPAVWRASQIGGGAQATSPSGFAALDAELPGGGWPHGVLTELLLPQPGIGELRLLAPVLRAVSAPVLPAGPASAAHATATVPGAPVAAAATGSRHRRIGAAVAATAAAASPVRAFSASAAASATAGISGGSGGAGASGASGASGVSSRSGPARPASRPPRPAAAPSDTGRCVMLFDPPASLSAWALAQCGLDSRHWLVVRSRPVGQGRQAGLSGPGRHTGTVGPWAPAGAGGSNAPAGNAGSDALAGNAGFGTTAGNAGFGTTAGNAGFGTTAGNAGSGTPPGRAVPLSPAWQPDTAPGVPRGASRLAPLLPGADLLWALEQALKSGQVGAVLAWLPVNLRADALRRLQLAAQAQAGPVFLFRDALARGRPSPAPLRLLLQPAGIDGLALRILKRRGPLLAQPMRLQLPPVLPPAVQARLQAEAEAARVGQGLAAGHAGLLAPQA